jgi:hypothetical protein
MNKVQPFYTGIGYPPLCHYCAHRSQEEPWRCTAYPEEIPQEVLWMNVDHRVPYVDDRGIQFSLRTDMDEYWYHLFLRTFFVDTRGRDEAAVRQEKEHYAELIRDILEKRKHPLPMPQ